jgi:hypothetical protein
METRKVLFALRKEPTEYETRSFDAASKAFPRYCKNPGATEVIDSREMNWRHLQRVRGGIQGAYEHCARTFQGLVIIEEEAETIGRGQATLVEMFLVRGKPVTVWRDDQMRRVTDIEEIDGGDWKSGYARCIV